MSRRIKSSLFCALIFHSWAISIIMPVRAEDSIPGMGMLFHNFGHNMVDSFTYGYGFYHAISCLGTYGLVKSGGDWRYYQTMVQNEFIPITGFPSVMLGGIVPFAVPTYLYFKGKSKKDSKMMITAFALTQAALISSIVTSGYKAITGRHPPEVFDDDEHTPDYSHDFHFGFMRRGIFDGWPSGHTTNAFAMASTLIELYPGNKTLKWWAMGYAFLIGWGVSTNIHWLSDAVAGVLIGYTIGKSVGRSFSAFLSGDQQEERLSFHITPDRIQLIMRF